MWSHKHTSLVFLINTNAQYAVGNTQYTGSQANSELSTKLTTYLLTNPVRNSVDGPKLILSKLSPKFNIHVKS